MSRKKSRNIKKVWCFECLNKTPPGIRNSDFLMPLRVGHYDLSPCGSSIDRRVIGICAEYLETKNDFQRENAEPVNVNHAHLVYRNA